MRITAASAIDGTIDAADVAAPDRADVWQSLSPSRAADFMACPLLYRFRVIDKLPEPASPAAVRGTVVHAVLERLFDLPAVGRTPARAMTMLEPAWESLVAAEPELAAMFDAESGERTGETQTDPDVALVDWLAECRVLVERYFALEDPALLEPAERELYVETLLDSGLTLRGYIDRVDIASTGELRIVDYKTGRSPGEFFEAKALFQMKFYALVIWRTRGIIPRMLKLIYLGNSEMLQYEPEERDLLATERKLEALWRAISRAYETGDWRANRSRMCDWCAHQALCPEWGGTPPPLPDPTAHNANDAAPPVIAETAPGDAARPADVTA
jgi:putative RecB family exonuclease